MNPGLQLRLEAVYKPKFCLIRVYVTTCIVSFGKADDVLCDASSLRPLVQGKPSLVGVVRRFEIREQFLTKP